MYIYIYTYIHIYTCRELARVLAGVEEDAEIGEARVLESRPITLLKLWISEGLTRAES